MKAATSITDLQRLEFLNKLSKSDLLLSEWEKGFVASFRMATRPTLWFTAGRRESVDKMRMLYGSEPEIAMPFPLAEPSPVNHTEADPAGCMYLTREDGRQFPCNEPAALQRKNGFRYCQACGEAVQTALKRRGEVMHLYPFP